MKGRAVADFKIDGTLNRPEITGHLTLDSAQARSSRAGVNLKRHQRIRSGCCATQW